MKHRTPSTDALILELIGDDGPPEKGNAAPAGNRDGAKGDAEVNIKNSSGNSEDIQAVIAELVGPSVLDAPIPMTFFPNDRAISKIDAELSPRDLARKIERMVRKTKRDLPGIKLQRYGNRKTDKGCLRNTANVEAVYGGEIDHDPKDGPMTMDEAADVFRKAGVAALLHMSASGKPNSWHALVPFSREMTPDQRTREVEKVNALMGGELDPHASFTVAQHAYYGAIEDGPPMRTILVDGQAIDTLDLPRLAKGKRKTEDGEERTHDESGSGALFALAGRMKSEGETFEAFEVAAWDDPASRAHLEKEETVGRGRADRALDRAWEKAPVHEGAPTDEFDVEVAPKKPSRLSFLSPTECGVAPQRGYVIKGLVAPGDVGCIFGAPGAGKSLLSPYLGYRVALGGQAFGMRTKAGGVFYVAAEDETGMRGRVAALKDELGNAEDFFLVGGVSNLFMGSPDFKALMAAIEERKPTLVIVDTLAMAFPGLEENSAESMGKVVTAARALSELGAAVVLVHHATKESNGTPRGHSILNGALDFAVELQAKDDAGIIRGRLTKNRNGPCDLDIAFRIAVTPMGQDDDGDEITFARCEPMTDAPKSGPKPTPAERAALDVLKGLDRGEGVDETEWRQACKRDRNLCASDDPESRRKAAYRAIQGLVRKRLVGLHNGRAWPSSASGDAVDEFDSEDSVSALE